MGGLRQWEGPSQPGCTAQFRAHIHMSPLPGGGSWAFLGPAAPTCPPGPGGCSVLGLPRVCDPEEQGSPLRCWAVMEGTPWGELDLWSMAEAPGICRWTSCPRRGPSQKDHCIVSRAR